MIDIRYTMNRIGKFFDGVYQDPKSYSSNYSLVLSAIFLLGLLTHVLLGAHDDAVQRVFFWTFGVALPAGLVSLFMVMSWLMGWLRNRFAEYGKAISKR